jgi:hypothetical protein
MSDGDSGQESPAKKPADPVPPGRKQRPRARDLGIPLDGTPGPANAITDVTGVEVGHTTLIRGGGRIARPSRAGQVAVLFRAADE